MAPAREPKEPRAAASRAAGARRGPAVRPAPAPARSRRGAPGARLALLEAAGEVLRQRGHAGLSTREVATAAGVPLSQIHYHFGSRGGLVIALFAHLTERLQHRQRAMFEDPTLTLAARWERACDHLDEDLASGYVRVLLELSVAGLSDPATASAVRAAHRGWLALIITVIDDHRRAGGALGDQPAAEIAALVGAAFVGASAYVLLGLERPGVPIRAALRRVGGFIRALERAPGGGRDHARQRAGRRG
jgi:AcrR family transcriptional regulator